MRMSPLALLLASLPLCAQLKEIPTTQKDLQSLAVTIYNQNLALVKDVVGVSEEDNVTEYGLSDNTIDALIEYLHATGRVLEGTDADPFTDVQYEQLVGLTRVLQSAFGFAAIAGHSDIAPTRKTDPGPRFDWPRFRNLLGQT